MVRAPFHPTPAMFAAIVVGVVLLFVVGLTIFYLVTRLRFAYFHCLIHDTKEIAPGWRLYATQATRFFLLNLVVGFCFLLLVGLVAVLFGTGIWRLVQESRASGHFDVGLMLSLVLPLIPVLLLLVILAFAADVILRDFMLPHYALDDATAGAAWSAVLARISAEKGSFFGYGLLRVILPILAMIAAAMVLIVPALLSGALVAVLEIGVHAVFGNATGAASGIGILVEVLIGLIALAVALFVGLCVGGPLSTAIREYALLFYGGRYPRLGDLLSPRVSVGSHAPGMV
ncbi:MAG TPA: hypothetical protein VHZ09_17425 [Acidobacteriaceae bacterium]|nr:hypothetical protein [Acidobacteriaceae bacterium]